MTPDSCKDATPLNEDELRGVLRDFDSDYRIRLLVSEVERSRALLRKVDDGVTDTYGDHIGPNGTGPMGIVGVRVELDRDAYLELKALLGLPRQEDW